MNEQRKTIANKIRELRKSKKLTQEDLAKKAHLERSVIAKIEGCVREISAIELAKIAQVFRVNMNALIYRVPVFAGDVEESIVEALGLLPNSKKKRVIDILKADLFIKVKKSKGEVKKKYRELKRNLSELQIED